MTIDQPFQATAVATGSGSIEENPSGGPRHNVPLGTLVHRAGLMELDEIEGALHEAVQSGRRLGEVLMDRGLGERELARLLAAQHAQPFVDLTMYPVDFGAARLLPTSVARTYCALPISQDDRGITVAVPDAEDPRQRERLREALRRPVRLVTAARTDIKETIGYLREPDPPAPSPPGREAVPASADDLAMFRVVVSLVNGRELVVGRAATQSAAEMLAARIAAEARVGAVIDTPDLRVDGGEIVSVQVVRVEEAE